MTTHAHVMTAGLATPAARRRPTASILAALRGHLAAWRERRRLADTRDALARLDAATLRDIGLYREEIGSVAAELHGHAVDSRRLWPAVHVGPGA